MLGRTHAVTGWCAGMATAPLLGLTAGPALIFAAWTTGAALVTDIDETRSTVSRSLGWLSGLFSRVLRGMSQGIFHLSRSSRDVSRRQASAKHRYLTHTLVWACGTGILAGLIPVIAERIGGPSAGAWSVLACGLLLVLLATKAVGIWALSAGLVGLAIVLASGELMSLNELTLHLGVAVVLGQVTHIAGDWMTEAPVPALWPIPIRGRRWYPCNAPAWMRFRVGSPVERTHIFPAAALLAVLLVPQAPELIAQGLSLLSGAFVPGLAWDVTVGQVWLGAGMLWLVLLGSAVLRGVRGRNRA